MNLHIYEKKWTWFFFCIHILDPDVFPHLFRDDLTYRIVNSAPSRRCSFRTSCPRSCWRPQMWTTATRSSPGNASTRNEFWCSMKPSGQMYGFKLPHRQKIVQLMNEVVIHEKPSLYISFKIRDHPVCVNRFFPLWKPLSNAQDRCKFSLLFSMHCVSRISSHEPISIKISVFENVSS